MSSISQFALALGRFQPLHLQHLEYLLEASRRAPHLVVGITNPAPLPRRLSSAPEHRDLASSNPFSYFDRYQMVRAALLGNGISPTSLTIVPAALGEPSFLDSLPNLETTTCWITVVDGWAWEKKRIIESYGIAVSVLFKRQLESEIITGTSIRERMRSGACWQHLVPPEIVHLLTDRALAERGLTYENA